ncbi:MAG: hypothetical protein VX000_04340 [Myxococcota bacterium]|nr:hypothetical protein [Myxococcota bacterium]
MSEAPAGPADDAPVPSRVDALFAGEPPPPPVSAGPRIRRLQRLLAVAIPLDLLGIPCWTGVPGAVLTLWAYLQADAEMARIDAGVYAGEDAASLLRLRSIATWSLYFCVASFLVQAWLLSTPFYAGLLGGLADAIARGVARLSVP